MVQISRQIIESIFIINLFRNTNVARIFYKSSQTYGVEIILKTTVIKGHRSIPYNIIIMQQFRMRYATWKFI
jgi:hypothetical protein